MVLEPGLAHHFIQEYTAFLLYCYKQRCHVNSDDELLFQLALGRSAYEDESNLFEEYASKNESISPEIVDAILSLAVNKWVYLRDTTKYSLFINSDASSAYAVLGLTDPLKEIFGCSGLYLETGIFCLDGKYVCDGIFSNHVMLGKGYRTQFNEIYKELKQAGKFFKSPAA